MPKNCHFYNTVKIKKVARQNEIYFLDQAISWIFFTIWKHLKSITRVSSMCKSCRYHVRAVKFVLKRTAMHVQNSVSYFQTNTTWAACETVKETHADSCHIQHFVAPVIILKKRVSGTLIKWGRNINIWINVSIAIRRYWSMFSICFNSSGDHRSIWLTIRLVSAPWTDVHFVSKWTLFKTFTWYLIPVVDLHIKKRNIRNSFV